MKIAFALEKFDKTAGGAESYAVDLARSLVLKGWEVHLIGYDWDNQPEGAIFHQIPRPPFFLPASLKLVYFASAHKRIVQTGDFDVVVGFGSTICMSVYQSHGGVHRLSSARKLLAVRNSWFRFFKKILMLLTPKYHVRSWIESAPFRIQPMPEIVAISDMIKDDIMNVYGLPDSRIRVIYNGIDGELFGKRTDRSQSESTRKSLGFDDHILFLFMSYDFRKKGVRFLVEAAARLRDVSTEKFGVVVVGRAPYPSLSRLVHNLGLDGIVVFPGTTKTPQVFYDACDVFVLPTFYDACSLVVFEAMSCGLPVITSAHNGAAGVIKGGLDGFIIQDPSDSEEICGYMKNMLDRSSLKQMSENALVKSREFSLEANHEQMTRVFMDAAQLRSSALCD